MKIKWLVIIFVAFLLITLFITYCISVGMQHRDWFLPSISQVTSAEPEASIFTWGMNISCFLLLIIITTKKQQFDRYLERVEEQPELWYPRNRFGQTLEPAYFVRLNIISLGFGVFSVIALSLISCFSGSNYLIFHDICAFCFFFGIYIYNCSVTRISFALKRDFHPISLGIKLFLCIINFVLIIIGFTLALISKVPCSYVAMFEYLYLLFTVGFIFTYFFDFKDGKVTFLSFRHSQTWKSQVLLDHDNDE